jgi:outer membrane protein assembly factor BamB
LLVLVALSLVLSTAKTAPTANVHAVLAASTGAWTVYHRDNGHTGYDPTIPAMSGVTTGWASATLDGEVYAEPLVFNGVVYAATLNNTVYALNQSTGAVVWQKNLGAPQTSGWVCGNVAPMGILGTPVIDQSANRIYAVALIAGTTPTYHLFGLDLANSGNIVLDTGVSPAGFDWKIQQERGALALANGYVYVPFGGRAGDCFDGSIPYYGWVVGAPTSGVGTPNAFRTPSSAESVWAAGGIVVDDTSHNVFFATGNAIPCAGALISDAVVRVSPTLASPTSFQPSDWQTSWCGPDSDLGSASPLLISPNLMFQAGKNGGGFLLDPTNLGGVNGQLYPPRTPYQQAEVCFGDHSGATFGSFAYSAPFIYLECDGHGLVALSTNTLNPSFSPCDAACAAPNWHVGGTTTFGPPIVAGGAVWVADINGSGLYAFNATNGTLMFQSAAFGVNHFVTPAEAGGAVFVPSHRVIRSFNMSFLPWTSLGGILTSGPDTGSGTATRVDVFVRGTDGGLWQDTLNTTTWSGWQPLGGGLTSSPGAVSTSATRIDVFVRGSDNQLWHKLWNGTSWQPWEPLGGGLTSGPDADAWSGPTHIDVFVRGTDNQLWHKWSDGTTWYPWEPLGGGLASDPGSVAWGPNRVDLFVRGTDSQLWHRWWDGIAWRGWEPLGGVLRSGPDVASCSSGHLDVFVVGTDGGIWQKSYNGSWSQWQPLGGTWTSDPSAVCQPGTTTVNLFERAQDQALWQVTVTGS